MPIDIVAAGAVVLHQGGDPDWLTLAGGSAWVATGGGIRRLDGRTGAGGAIVPITSICTAMDAGFGAVWAADCERGVVVRVDPATASVTATYEVGDGAIAEEGSIGVGEGGIWVATTTPSLVRIDAATGLARVFPLPVAGAGVRVGLGSVWVTAPLGSSLLRIDPSDGSIKQTIAVGRGPRFLAVGSDAMWVQNNGDGTVSKVDAAGKVVAMIPVSPTPIDGGDMAFGGGFAWARTGYGLVTKIDGATGGVAAIYGPSSGSGSVAADKDSVWISAHDVSTVWRLALD